MWDPVLASVAPHVEPQAVAPNRIVFVEEAVPSVGDPRQWERHCHDEKKQRHPRKIFGRHEKLSLDDNETPVDAQSIDRTSNLVNPARGSLTTLTDDNERGREKGAKMSFVYGRYSNNQETR